MEPLQERTAAYEWIWELKPPFVSGWEAVFPGRGKRCQKASHGDLRPVDPEADGRRRDVRFIGQSILSGAEIQGANRWHFAFGAGAAFPHFQLDLGLGISKFVGTASLSAIVSV